MQYFTLSTRAAFVFAFNLAKTCDPTVVGMPNVISVTIASYVRFSPGHLAKISLSAVP